jgi:hypothetical protein
MSDLLSDLKVSLETGDAALWSSLHSDDFEHTELWHKTDPPSNPVRRTKADLAEIVGRAVKNGVEFRVENMVGDDRGIAYTVRCILPNGRTVISNNTCEVRDNLIVNQLVVEAGEPDS